MIKKFFQAFPALSLKNYQLYFNGQLISLVGTWLQTVAQGWLVLQITHSAFWVGAVSALGSIPILIFTLIGGIIVDRFDKKKIIILTQTSSMVLAIILGLITITGIVNLAHILILSFLLGIVNALDFPARQAYVIEMVGREKLASAVALNSAQFNGARVIGPGIAGYLIALFGLGGSFLINGISYIAVIIALFFIKSRKILSPSHPHPHPLKAIKEGLNYAFSHNLIRILLVFTGITSIFGWSYGTIMPVFVQNVFHKDVSTLGLFYSAAGVGAVFGTIIISAFSKKTNFLNFIISGNLLFSISLIIFSLTSKIPVALIALFFAGTGLIMQFSTISTIIQHKVEDHLRGRVMSIYTLMFIGMTPFGSLLVGFLAERLGPKLAIIFEAFILFILGAYFIIKRESIRKEIEKD